jgi:hypothetical protein
MKITWEMLAQCLRDEVQEYGGLLRLFEEQQDCVFRRDADQLLQLIELIRTATESAGAARGRREECASAYAVECGRGADSTLRALLPCVDGQAQPLIEALIDEVNRLIHRVRKLARQNHLLLARTVELQQGLLRQFYPGAFTPTYSAHGRVALAAGAPVAAYQAAG